MIVMAYIGVFRGWLRCVGFCGLASLAFACGNGKPPPGGCVAGAFVGVRASTLSSGLGTENIRVMKIVRRFGSLGMASLESARGSSLGMFEGVKDLAKLLLLRKPSPRPKEPDMSCMLGPSTVGSGALVSSGTMCILFELPR